MPDQPDSISLSVIIPAYLEENNIRTTLESLREYFSSKSWQVEYIVVDDGSTDATSQIASDAGARVIRFEHNQGKGAAVRAGMLEGEGDFLLFTDADYPYDISVIEKCLVEFDRGADVVIGSRNLPQSDRGRERMKRRIISRIGNIVAHLLILPGISDTQAGFKCFRKDAARRIFSMSKIDGWGFDIEILYLARMLGMKIREVPLRLIPRSIKPSRIQSPTRTALSVLGSIFRVHMNRIAGRYRVGK
jgi:dolichyl-phosphate beta-glucosyltransferase